MRPFTPSHRSPPSADEAVAKLRLWFRHRSLRELEATGALDWDRAEGVVKKGSRFDSMWNEVPDRIPRRRVSGERDG